MLILNADEVQKALPMKQAIEAMKQAYASLSNGTAVVPLRTRLPIPNSNALSLFMPAYVHSKDNEALAIKAVSLFPTNPFIGIKTKYHNSDFEMEWHQVGRDNWQFRNRGGRTQGWMYIQ